MRRLVLIAIILFLAAIPAVAEDEDERRRAERTRKEAAIRAAETVVITNDVLEALYGRAAAPVPGEAPAERETGSGEGKSPEPDALQVMRDRAGRARTVRRLAAEAREEVAEAQEEVNRLERNALAVRNPYLARPKIPADQKEEWDRMDGAERFERTQEDLRKARERLETARERLERLEKES